MDASTTASCIVAVAVVIVYQTRELELVQCMDVTIGLINSRNKIETIDNEDNNTDDDNHH